MLPISEPKILVADDEPVIADSLATILSHAGFTTLAVYSGEAALQAAQVFYPDLFVCDVHMPPGISGFEAALSLAQQLPTCRILLVSGHAAAASLLKAPQKREPIFEILSKPVHPAYMIERVRACLSGDQSSPNLPAV